MSEAKPPKWRRLAPGRYELRDGQRLLALVERSAILPCMWWWAAFNERVDTAALCGEMRLSKVRAEQALAGRSGV